MRGNGVIAAQIHVYFFTRSDPGGVIAYKQQGMFGHVALQRGGNARGPHYGCCGE